MSEAAKKVLPVDEEVEEEVDFLQAATSEQVADVAEWLTNHHFRVAIAANEGLTNLEAIGDEKLIKYKQGIFAMTTHSRTLLNSPNVYHANLCQMQESRRLVRQLIQLDRLPKETSVEGLLLLRSAWCDFDVAILLASRYKRATKVAFALQLLFGFSAVTASTVHQFFSAQVACDIYWTSLLEESFDGFDVALTTAGRVSVDVSSGGSAIDSLLPSGRDLPRTLARILVHVVFGISVMMTLVMALDSLLNSKSRWRHLRSGAHAIESTIWLYRTRVSIFEVEEAQRNPLGPEVELKNRLLSLRTSLLAGANLATSELLRRHPPSTYKHYQDRGVPHDGQDADDHQSPVQPHRYISLRIKPTLHFYQKRIPRYARRGVLLKYLVVTIGVGASVLAHYEQVSWVVVITALGSAVTSWVEFSDTQRKTERYTRAVNALSGVLDWWHALGEVEKASKTNITHLVTTSENIISEEHLAWTSTSSSTDARDSSVPTGNDEAISS